MFKIMATTTAEKKPELPGMTGPGVERVAIDEIDALVEKYVKARDARMQKTEAEVSAKQSLIASLHANESKLPKDGNGALVYRHDDLVVTLISGKEKLKVRTLGEDDDED